MATLTFGRVPCLPWYPCQKSDLLGTAATLGICQTFFGLTAKDTTYPYTYLETLGMRISNLQQQQCSGVCMPHRIHIHDLTLKGCVSVSFTRAFNLRSRQTSYALFRLLKQTMAYIECSLPVPAFLGIHNTVTRVSRNHVPQGRY